RRRSFYLCWMLAWVGYGVWMFVEVPGGPAGSGRAAHPWAAVVQTAACVWHAFWWLRGVRQVLASRKARPGPTRPAGSESLGPGAILVTVTAVAVAARFLLPEGAYQLLEASVLTGLYGGSAVMFGLAARRLPRVGTLLLATFTGLLALQAAHYAVLFSL